MSQLLNWNFGYKEAECMMYERKVWCQMIDHKTLRVKSNI